jgi:SatD family (SatD)
MVHNLGMVHEPAFPMRAALIGDVTGSRHAGDREGLQTDLRNAIVRANTMVEADQPLTITLGDEFQGAYLSPAEALRASFWLQVLFVGVADLKLGIGWGELYFGGDDPPLDQDGPCWWRARDALETVEREAKSHRVPSTRRTVCLTGEPEEGMIAAYLLLRDQLMSEIDEVDAGILLALSAGRTQAEIASDQGVNRSSISRRIQSHGLQALLNGLDVERTS